MKIKDSVAFVTGANRGLGLSLVRALQAAGARKIYAGARDPASVTIPGVIPVQLDVTKPEQIAAAVAACGDTTLLFNNAGIAKAMGFLDTEATPTMRDIFATNVFGLVEVSRAFAPVLAENGGGAMVNVLSVASWINSGALSIYAASKSAAWGATNGLRVELKKQGTQVVALHVGFMDTDMTRGFEVDKITPDEVARLTLAGVESGAEEVLADEISRNVKQGLISGLYLNPPERQLHRAE
jgi:NAD(P)-dependent dehydrogenase (short-subunit alcohol dehydrogenase family)